MIKYMLRLLGVLLLFMFTGDMEVQKKRKSDILAANLGKGDIFGLINATRCWSSDDSKEALESLLRGGTRSSAKAVKTFLPNDYSTLFSYDRFRGKGTCYLDNLLFWYVNVINLFAEEINQYVVLRRSYLSFLLRGEYQKAQDDFEKIKKLGCSFWSLENEFILAEYLVGVDKNKERLAEIENADRSIWIAVFAEFFSFKAEKSINNRQYTYRVSRMSEGTESDIKAFLKEKAYPLSDIEMDDIISVLKINSAGSIFDIYDAYVKVCVRVVSDKSTYEETKQAVLQSLKKIERIEDPTIKKLRLSHKQYEVDKLDVQMSKIGDMYTSGDYLNVSEMCLDMLRKEEITFEIIEYYVKSTVLSNGKITDDFEDSILGDLLSSMFYSYAREKEVRVYCDNLFRIERITSNLGLGCSIANFIVDKYTTDQFEILNTAKEYMSPFLNARIGKTRTFPEDIDISALLGAGVNSQFVSAIGDEQVLDNIENVENDRLRWYQIIALKEKETQIDKLSLWRMELEQCADSSRVRYYIERISTLLFYLYLETGNVIAAERIFVSCYLKNKNSVLRMNIREIPYHMDDPELKKAIETPIIAYLCTPTDYGNIFCSLANFLDENGYSKPSELFEKMDLYNRDSFIFLMQKVCRCEVMDSLYCVFESDDEVGDERLEICKKLQELDSDNASLYVEEISSLIKNRKIIQGLKYIEEVKINLDIYKVIDEHRSVFEDNLKRFIEMGNLDIEYKAIDIPKQLIFIKETEKKEKYSHKLTILKEVISDFQHELAFGKFGLDQTLGTRIRHGSLQNQIRVVFERNGIIFVKRNLADREYLVSESFFPSTQYVSQNEKHKIQRIISNFSKKIDDYISEIKEQNVQIRIGDLHPNGLIDLSVQADELIGLFEGFQKIANAGLILEALESFWMLKIEEGLEHSRIYFSTSVKKKFVKMLDDLDGEIRNNANEALGSQFSDAITKCRTEIQTTVDTITNWFRLPTQKVYPPFDLHTFIDTCLRIFSQIFTSYSEIDVDTIIESEMYIKGEYFSYLVDILVILFTNAYVHSGFENELSNLQIQIRIYEENDKMVIEMVNNLNNTVDKKEISDRIHLIQEKILHMLEENEYQNYEGGSGFVKICKILQWDMEKEWNMEFGLDDKEELFFVILYVSKLDITGKEI